MEGSLCIWGIRKIDVDCFTTEWLPESEEEKKDLELFSISRSIKDSPPDGMPDAPMDLSEATMLSVEELKEFETPLNFYRRGILDIAEEKFIEAIYDLYFVLETLYGNGKF